MSKPKLTKLDALLQRTEAAIPDRDRVNPAVSAGSVGWHIAHLLLTQSIIVDALSRSNPADYKPSFNWKRLYLRLINRIPRGRIKAPKPVQPSGEFDTHSLLQQLAATKQKIGLLQALSPQQFFTHPFLGALRRQQAIWFLELHTRHHLNIIDEIRK